MIDKTDKLIKKFGKATNETVTPIGDDIIIPNLSGIKKNKKRYIVPLDIINSAGTFNLTAGWVFLNWFEVEYPITVSGMTFLNGAAVAGNIIVGIYGPIVTEDTCEGSPLIATSAITAQAGVGVNQYIPFTTNVTLQPGRYYAAIEISDITGELGIYDMINISIQGLTQYYDRGSFGALTTTCPAVTLNTSIAPLIFVRCI